MNKDLLLSLRVSLLTIFLTGIFYPYFLTEISNLLFFRKAKGSLIHDEGKKVIGSELIGQAFNNPAYFFPRPSLAGKGYDGLASGGSNDSPTSKKLKNRIEEKTNELKKQNEDRIPIDLVTASGSGLDPHISAQAAYWQAPKIALARDVSLKRVLLIISENIEPPQLGFLGTERVNVFKLNLALDQYLGQPESSK